ncbi:lon protease homolog, mitochondrial-like [Quercus lobata]|uniref:lon protease homolog, mitochondrial-like n=1 Tax=Quercus lobata TaxID=97700 RepID=UPI001247D922|nr:lon protease homolog, mitochondrial-like [Quercus lobata]
MHDSHGERVNEKIEDKPTGKILCFSGPPGLGKKSLVCSIARALNRKFFRITIGRLTNIAEIKGHFRINVSSMPGKMVQCLKTVGTANPLVLIDGVYKLGRQHARDLTNAVLDLLDPEQNVKFVDNFFFFPIDLSKVSHCGDVETIEVVFLQDLSSN